MLVQSATQEGARAAENAVLGVAEGGRHAVEAYTELKTVAVAL